MDNKNTFIIYRSFFETLQKYQQAGKDAEGFDLFMKVANYQLNGILPDENDNVWFQGFNDIIVPIDKAQERYAQARENGKKGGRPQKVSMFDVKELLDQGRTKAEIAKTLNCSVSTIEKKSAAIRKGEMAKDNENCIHEFTF